MHKLTTPAVFSLKVVFTIVFTIVGECSEDDAFTEGADRGGKHSKTWKSECSLIFIF